MSEIEALRLAVETLTHAVLGRRLTRAELCERIGKDSHTITRWIRRGTFPAPKGGAWMLADVVAWERSQTLGNVGRARIEVDQRKTRVAPSKDRAQGQHVNPAPHPRRRRVSAVVESES